MSVAIARREELAEAWRSVAISGAGVLTRHPLAQELVIDSLFTTDADASTEATRVQALRGVDRSRFQFTVELNAANALVDLGDTIKLTSSRFGLSAGVLFRVVAIDADLSASRVTFTVWGS